MRPQRVALAGLAGAALLMGCGGSAKVDKGGFTAGDRRAAQTALDLLSQTSVKTAAVNLVATVGVPAACRVHIESRKPLTFRFFMSWIPRPGSDRTYSWVQAVIGPDGLKRDYAFHVGNETSVAALKSHYGTAFSKPYEPCEVTNINTFSLVPFGAKVASSSTYK